MTTPDACFVARTLATMRDRGCRACAIETSSHALDQGRVAGVPFAGAAFTNLTGDHLDYHKTMENYAAAKAQLFTSLDAEAVAVVNADDKYSDRMIQDCCSRIIRFGFGKKADYRARDCAVTASGTHFVLHTPDGRAEVFGQTSGGQGKLTSTVWDVSLAQALVPRARDAWEKGGRRTSTYGMTGLAISRTTKHPELAWELAKYLYYNKEDLGARFAASNPMS